MKKKNKSHDKVKFFVESFEIKGATETKTKYQAFYGNTGVALSEICESEAIATMQAIKNINENRDRF